MPANRDKYVSCDKWILPRTPQTKVHFTMLHFVILIYLAKQVFYRNRPHHLPAKLGEKMRNTFLLTTIILLTINSNASGGSDRTGYSYYCRDNSGRVELANVWFESATFREKLTEAKIDRVEVIKGARPSVPEFGFVAFDADIVYANHKNQGENARVNILEWEDKSLTPYNVEIKLKIPPDFQYTNLGKCILYTRENVDKEFYSVQAQN